MTQIINTLALGDAQPGMCLATDLHNTHGNLLLPRHTELTSQLITSLHKQGITSLQIRCELPAAPGAAEADATQAAYGYQQQYDNIMNEVRQMFPGSNLDSVNHALQQVILEYRLAQLPPRPAAQTSTPLSAIPQEQPDSRQ